jgi:DNA-binding XRE family transcriptional regulator
VDEDELPPMPPALPNGNYPAIESARVMLARDLITLRKTARLSQAEVARRAGVRPETLNRIEKAKVSADLATVDKIIAVLSRAKNSSHRG